MVLWIILVVLALIVIVILYFLERPEDDYPTIHAECDANCGGTLVCDRTSHTCKQTENQPCAMDVDCVGDLRCINWQCSNQADTYEMNEPLSRSSHNRNVSFFEVSNFF